ncbi:MAG: STAS domain-containing protein [Terracidiphilus sp.]|jgi:anti-anti-sigma regulatory factor
MGISIKESEVGNLLVLEGTIDIGCAAELKAVLLEALGSGGEIRVILGAVAYMDVTASQLLWAAELQAQRSGVVFQISGPLPEIVSTLLTEAGFPSLPISLSAE